MKIQFKKGQVISQYVIHFLNNSTFHRHNELNNSLNNDTLIRILDNNIIFIKNDIYTYLHDKLNNRNFFI